MRAILALGLLVGLLTADVRGTDLIANFDDQTPGTLFISDGGISFRYDDGIGQGFGALYISAAGRQNLDNSPAFTAPNVADLDSYATDPNNGPGLGSLNTLGFGIGKPAIYTQLDVWYDGGGLNTLTLEGLRNGNVVASSSFQELPVVGQFTKHVLLSLGGGTFDSFLLVSSGPENNGHSFITFDNVLVRPVPEPAAWMLAAVGGMGFLGWRRRGGFGLPRDR
jgi:hypothetical protein